jgi:hypothetical protein
VVLSRGGTIPGVADLAALTAEDFRALLQDRFVLSDGARSDQNGDAVSFEVELVEVNVIPREPVGRAPFSLVFQGDPELTLPQRIYRVEHPELGALDIFLVPIAPGRYEAVFT